MISLLHVDSDTHLQKELKEYLEHGRKIRVETLVSASDALELIKTKKIDVIVSEYFLPATDGQTFLDALRRVRKDTTPFIFFAKKTSNDVVIKLLNTGATSYILKGKDPRNEFSVLKHFIVQAVRQKRTEDALKESERQYRSVVEDQSEFIMRFMPDGTLVFVNEAYCNYFSSPRDKLLGKNIFDIIPPAHRDSFHRHLSTLTREHPVSIADSRFATDEGKVKWQRWNNRAIFDEEGRVIEFQAVGRDITDQKNAETALLQAHKNLGIMNTITRHDILNQLTVVFGFLDLAGETSNDPGINEYLQKAHAAADSIHTQILFTKDYQEIGSNAAQWQNLDEVIGRAGKGLDLSGIHLECTLTDLWVYADPLIEKVFFNLMDNSLRHGENVSHIRLSSFEDESGLTIVYEDNGTGVPEGAKEKIFRREYFKNTGLGLYLIREILAITNILIRETGIFGKGARFEMCVPRGKYGTGMQQEIPGTKNITRDAV